MALDTMEAGVSRGALVVDNTGYDWGFDGRIGLSELLMLNFTQQVLEGNIVTAGRAVMTAKQQYYAEDSHLDVYDEKKILMATTLYALPITRIVTPDAQVARASSVLPAAPGLTRGQSLSGNGYLTMTHVHFDLPQLTAIMTETDQGIDYIGRVSVMPARRRNRAISFR